MGQNAEIATSSAIPVAQDGSFPDANHISDAIGCAGSAFARIASQHRLERVGGRAGSALGCEDAVAALDACDQGGVPASITSATGR